jgi:diaminohydroxyphosphoribosylaminopyrimidine deaminase/5-amino-6-(5-phosphoribosylamino)uracil reductase
MALEQAGERAAGATLYVTLEPCAHASARGPACAELVAGSKLARVVVGYEDTDLRTAGAGLSRIREAGIPAELVSSPEVAASLAGYLTRARKARPYVTLKLAISLDGCIALSDGTSRWITGEAARAHAHLERARADAILVGGGTLRTDEPRLDVRLPGLETRSPERWVLTGAEVPDGWRKIASPKAIGEMADCQYLLVEGGSQTAAAFLAADLVDRLLIYRAPILIGDGLAALGDIGRGDLASAQDRWCLLDSRKLGSDALEVYQRTPCSPE